MSLRSCWLERVGVPTTSNIAGSALQPCLALMDEPCQGWPSTIQQSYGGGFLKWWVYPTAISFPTKNDHDLGCEMGGNPPFKETPI